MEEKEYVTIEDDDVEVIVDGEKYYAVEKDLSGVKGFTLSIFKKINKYSEKLKMLLYASPEFIEAAKSAVSRDEYRAIFSDEQKKQLAKGTIKLMKSKKGKLFANLVNKKTGKIIGTVNLEKMNLSSNLTASVNNLLVQNQLAKITEEIKYVQKSVEEIGTGQENDRLAIAYSCKQKLLQAMAIENPETKKMALLNIISTAEDSRNQLMLSQTSSIESIKKIPESSWKKFFGSFKQDELKDKRMIDLRENMNALNMVSLAETLAYQELGEQKSANIALCYYGDYINRTYLSDIDFLERLDSLNPSNKRYWSTALPEIGKKVELISKIENINLIEEYYEEK